MTQQDKKDHWERLVGSFVMNFGSIEAISCHWIYELTKDQNARDKAIGLKLGQRLKQICELIPNSTLSNDEKKRALELWSEVIELSKVRNIIAHSPFITNNQNESGFIDIKEMKGVLDGSPVPIKPLTFQAIAAAGSRTFKIFQELVESFWRKKGDAKS